MPGPDPPLSLSPTSLTHLALFDGLSPDRALRLIGAAHQHHAAPGDAFFEQGEDVRHLHVLASGQAKLRRVSAEGRVIVVQLVRPGEPMGGIVESAQPGSAVAITEAVALAWESKDADRLALEHPRFAMNLLRARTHQLADAQHRIAELTTARAEQRVALALLRLAEASGQELTAQKPTPLPVSREDVAQMAGTTLYTASRVMSGWEREGLLELGRQRVVILAAQDLQRRTRS